MERFRGKPRNGYSIIIINCSWKTYKQKKNEIKKYMVQIFLAWIITSVGVMHYK